MFNQFSILIALEITNELLLLLLSMSNVRFHFIFTNNLEILIFDCSQSWNRESRRFCITSFCLYLIEGFQQA